MAIVSTQLKFCSRANEIPMSQTLFLLSACDVKDASTYQNIVQDILFMMHIQKQVVTPTDLANYTFCNSSEMTINYYLLTKEQLPIFLSQAKRVIFQSDFGTGKTVLLRAQAQKLAIPRKRAKDSSKIAKNICFVIFLEESAMLVKSIQEFAREFLNIDVLFLKSAGNYY